MMDSVTLNLSKYLPEAAQSQAIETILGPPNCAGLSSYRARQLESPHRVVLVIVNANLNPECFSPRFLDCRFSQEINLVDFDMKAWLSRLSVMAKPCEPSHLQVN